MTSARQRLLLLSNSRNAGQGYLEHAGDVIRAFLGPAVKTVLFVPYAAVRVSYDAFAASVGIRLREWGYRIECVHLRSDPAAAVQGAEAVMVGGGNTFQLLKALYEHGLVEALRARARCGTPYVGWSAGANVAGPSIRTTNDMPIVEPPSFAALGLVPFQINPHYTDAVIPDHAGETRAERLLEFVTANPGVSVVGLREGSILRVEGGALELLGSKPARVFVGGREPTEHEPGASLQFLME
ncbi:MAG TPA: dipeptidase PepE [Gemmatimonadales bacterium]|nr:dipeptidase PepE [Gemmatimonadales bacterium]